MMFSKRYPVRLADTLFVLAYGFALFRGAIGNTTFSKYFSIYGPFLIFTIIFVTANILCKIILLDKFLIQDLLIILVAMAVFGISFLRSGYSELVILMILMLGSKNIRIKNVVKTHFIVYGSVTLVSVICSLLGIIENFKTFDGSYSLGNTYSTDFAAGIFALTLDYAYLKTRRWKLRYSIIYAIIALAVYEISHARMGSILILALGLVELIFSSEKTEKVRDGKGFKVIVSLLFPILAGISLAVQGMYDKLTNPIFRVIDIFTSHRIAYGYQAIQKYGLRPWGRRIDFIGAGWNTNTPMDSSYFYVDNGYLQCALLYGLIILILICAGYFYISISKKNRLDPGLTIALLFYSVWGVIEPRIFYLIYAPFLIAIGITLLSDEDSCNQNVSLIE